MQLDAVLALNGVTDQSLMHAILHDALPVELRHLSPTSTSSQQPYDDLCSAVLASYGLTYHPLPFTRDFQVIPASQRAGPSGPKLSSDRNLTSPTTSPSSLGPATSAVSLAPGHRSDEVLEVVSAADNLPTTKCVFSKSSADGPSGMLATSMFSTKATGAALLPPSYAAMLQSAQAWQPQFDPPLPPFRTSRLESWFEEFAVALYHNGIWIQELMYEVLEYHLPHDLKHHLTYFSWSPRPYDHLRDAVLKFYGLKHALSPKNDTTAPGSSPSRTPLAPQPVQTIPHSATGHIDSTPAAAPCTVAYAVETWSAELSVPGDSTTSAGPADLPADYPPVPAPVEARDTTHTMDPEPAVTLYSISFPRTPVPAAQNLVDCQHLLTSSSMCPTEVQAPEHARLKVHNAVTMSGNPEGRTPGSPQVEHTVHAPTDAQLNQPSEPARYHCKPCRTSSVQSVPFPTYLHPTRPTRRPPQPEMCHRKRRYQHGPCGYHRTFRCHRCSDMNPMSWSKWMRRRLSHPWRRVREETLPEMLKETDNSVGVILVFHCALTSLSVTAGAVVYDYAMEGDRRRSIPATVALVFLGVGDLLGRVGASSSQTSRGNDWVYAEACRASPAYSVRC
ncbi:hypothetical protein HPB51_017754 [Rhipicephalus microplus]|uniref:Uncharacterized protein n=1 Tax=Rhipicephalus microplus TaxID=6941 RepID=A0A9J6ENS4_RHIMP|nr:hypothetical protein HPB51_017754 [Rhipicephalus microplus]